MVCPMCITAAIVANAPAIAAAASGAAAAKLAYDRRGGAASGGRGPPRAAAPRGAGGKTQVARMVVERAQLPPVLANASLVEDE